MLLEGHVYLLASILAIPIFQIPRTSFSHQLAKIRARRERKVTRMVTLLILAFNVSWAPYALVCTIQLLCPTLVRPSWAVPSLLLAKR